MAILIVEHNGTAEGASLAGRVLIGRRPNNHVVVDDPAVSRIHAWIDAGAGSNGTGPRLCFLTDAGSRTGTFVNGQRIAAHKVPLRDGDRITVGPASLTFRVDAALPSDVAPLHFQDRRRRKSALDADADADADAAAEGGILVDCACGAPLWVAAMFFGKRGKCRFCGAVIDVPDRRGGAKATPAPVGAAGVVVVDRPPRAPAPARAAEVVAAPAAACGACQSEIAGGESVTTCPACGLTFHADCWTENLGCAAYGCSQVNALAPTKAEPAEIRADETADADDDDPAPPVESIDDDDAPKATAAYALLAASVVGVVAGALTFGVPALLALAADVVYLLRRKNDRAPRVVLAAALLALLGAAAGVVISYVWWLES
jgi:hypothetical protein